VGYFMQKYPPLGRQQMEMRLTFRAGVLQGEGRDRVGLFLFRGRYDVTDGRCYWTKRYLGRHDVFYKGYNEGKGIWGTWEIPASKYAPALRGGFHIWPEGMADPEDNHLTTAADLPLAVTDESEAEKVFAVPVGGPGNLGPPWITGERRTRRHRSPEAR
jgi:hypothetical protein